MQQTNPYDCNTRKIPPHQSPTVTASPRGGSQKQGLPGRLALPQNRGRGMPRPYRAMIFYCPVGRGDPTPPGSFATAANCPERSRPLPTNRRKTSNYRQNTCSRQVCRGRIYASRGVYPAGRFTGIAATGGIVAVPTVCPPAPLYTNFTYTLPVYAGKTHTVSFIIETGLRCGILPRPHTNNRTDV